MNDPSLPINRWAAVFVILAAAMWGVDGIVLRPALYNLPVPLVVFLESGLITLLLTPVLLRRWQEIRQLTIKEWLIFLAIALSGGVIGTMAITKALFYVDYVNLSIVILIQKLQPVFAVTYAVLLLKERPSPAFYGWSALAVLGAYLVTFGMKLPVMQDDKTVLFAAAFSLLAAASFGASTVFSKMGLQKVDYRTGTYLRFALMVLLMGIILGFSPESQKFAAVTTRHMYIFLIIAFTTGGAAIFLYYYGLRRISASS